MKQQPGGYDPNNGRKYEGACESFPRFLRADGRCKWVLTEKYAGRKTTHIVGNNTQDERRNDGPSPKTSLVKQGEMCGGRST